MIIHQDNNDAHYIASRILKEGGVICFATETVYALACDAGSDVAVQKLYNLKKRNPIKPISVMVGDLEVARKFLEINPAEEKIANSFMPGSITLVLKKKDRATNKLLISEFLNSGKNTLGLRIPNHKFSLVLLREFGGIMAATSANISAKTPAISFSSALEYFDDNVDLIIDGGVCCDKIPSTVLKVDGPDNKINIIRNGKIGIESLNKVL
jgi:L-threonylcarbamoyladenylate synthase